MKTYILPILIMSLLSCQTDLDDEAIQALLTGTNTKITNIETIVKEDPLYNYLALLSNNDKPDLIEVGCIEFIYPFVLFQFDGEDNFLNQVSIQGNENFVEILANLNDGYSIGLSYPISGNLIDGTQVTVENNNQLQNSLETCIEEELEIIIDNCNSIATTEECIWKVTQSDPAESPYIDSFFNLNEDGSVVFSLLQKNEDIENEVIAKDEQVLEYETEVGTWIFYFIGPELHMNINFGPIEKDDEGEIAEENQIKSNWNFDWKINYIDQKKIEIEKMYTETIASENGEVEEIRVEKITLEKECIDNKEEEDASDD